MELSMGWRLCVCVGRNIFVWRFMPKVFYFIWIVWLTFLVMSSWIWYLTMFELFKFQLFWIMTQFMHVGKFTGCLNLWLFFWGLGFKLFGFKIILSQCIAMKLSRGERDEIFRRLFIQFQNLGACSSSNVVS